ncbi:phosphotransferase enzyme family protein [Glycomyces tenuis]|uniref:phosphotransferase enzyme family protein n=1 Tax=Glycomyces tenuis TaxID=58116 RepID=UPI00042465A0|nr:phosphotransferase [Glycomyces tenuis]
MPPDGQSYADAARAAADAALTRYDLPAPVTAEPIRMLNNAVFAVTAAKRKRLVLRLHRPRYRRPEHTLAELVFLEAVHRPLAEVGIRIPRPFRAANDALTVTVTLPDPGGNASQQVHCDLLTWVDGQVRRPGTGLGPRGVHRLGRVLAHLHRAAESFAPPDGFQLPTWDAQAMFTEHSPYRPGPFHEFLTREDRSAFATTAELTAEVFETLGRDRETFGLIHYDFILGNCHTVRTGSGWSAGVIDFDDCGWGHFLYDLAPIMGNLSDYRHFGQLRTAFLQGYRSVRALPIAFEAHLPVLMAARHAAHCLWASGLAHSNGSAELDTADHIAYRMREVRRCLAMRSQP